MINPRRDERPSNSEDGSERRVHLGVDLTMPDEPEGTREAFGEHYAQLAAFANLLATHGVERGLIGPREVSRIWERHIINSAGVASFIPKTGHLIDVGSGAGLPGIVVAILCPDLEVELVEPMERRINWLTEVVNTLELLNVTVSRGRAEQLHKSHRRVDVVTARAVARLEKLAKWCLPLVADGGELVAVKGERAAAEIDEAEVALRKLGGVGWSIENVIPIAGVAGVTVVRVKVDRQHAVKRSRSKG